MHLQRRGTLTSELTAVGTFSPLPHGTTSGKRHVRGACSRLGEVTRLWLCALAGFLFLTMKHHLKVDLFKALYGISLSPNCSIALLQEALENLLNVIQIVCAFDFYVCVLRTLLIELVLRCTSKLQLAV